MNDEKYNEAIGKAVKAGCGALLTFSVAVLLAMLLGLLLGCKTQYVPVERVSYVYDTKHDSIVKIDSIHVKDSVWIVVVGDTVKVDRWHTEYRDRWRDRLLTDTMIRVDTIPQIVAVEKPPNAWQRIQIYGFRFLALAVGCAVVLWLIIKRL